MLQRPELGSVALEAQKRLDDAYRLFTHQVENHQRGKVAAESRKAGAQLFAATAAELDRRNVLSRRDDMSLTQTYLSQRQYVTLEVPWIAGTKSGNMRIVDLHNLAQIMANGGWFETEGEGLRPLSENDWKSIAQAMGKYEQDLANLLLLFPQAKEKLQEWVEQILDAIDQVEPKDAKKGNPEGSKPEPRPLLSRQEREILKEFISKKLDAETHSLLPFFKHLNPSGTSAVSLTRYLPLTFWREFLQDEVVRNFAGVELRHQSRWQRLWQGKFGTLIGNHNTKIMMARKLSSLPMPQLYDSLAAVELDMSLGNEPLTIGELAKIRLDAQALPNLIYGFQAIDELRTQAQAYLEDLAREPHDPSLDNAAIVHEAVSFWVRFEEYTQKYSKQLLALNKGPVAELIADTDKIEGYVQHDLFHLVAAQVDELPGLLAGDTLLLPGLEKLWSQKAEAYTEPLKSIIAEYFQQLLEMNKQLLEKVAAFAQDKQQAEPDLMGTLLTLLNERAAQLQMKPEQVIQTLLRQLSAVGDGEIDPALLSRLQARMAAQDDDVSLDELLEDEEKQKRAE